MKNIFILFILLNLSGCVSTATKLDGFGHPYEGTTSAAESAACFFGEGLDGTFMSVLFAVDVGLSAVLDTVFLPIDLVVTPDDSRNDDCIVPGPAGR